MKFQSKFLPEILEAQSIDKASILLKEENLLLYMIENILRLDYFVGICDI